MVCGWVHGVCVCFLLFLVCKKGMGLVPLEFGKIFV